MVNIPTVSDAGIGQGRSKIATNNFQNDGATAASFGGIQAAQMQDTGNALQSAGGAIAGNLQKIQLQKDKAEAYSTYNDLSGKANDYLNNPETGLYNKKGANAIDAYKNSLTNFDELYTKSSEGLSGGAKERFDALWQVKRENLLNSVSNFEVRERNQYKVQAQEATLKTSVNDAVENFNNPEFISDSIAIGEAIIRDSMEGSPPELIKLKTEMFKTEVHNGVVNRMLIDNTVGATAYYEKHKDEISGPQQVVIEKMIESGSIRSAAQAVTDQIVTKHVNFEDQLEAARKIKDPKIRDEAVSRVKQRYSENQTIIAERTKEIKSDAWKTVIETKNIDKIPIQQWAALDGATQKTMNDYVNRTTDPKTNIRKWKDLSDLHAYDPKAFEKVEMLDYINDLSASDFKDFSEKQQKLSNGDTANSIKVRTYNQIANDRLGAIGIKTTSAASKEDQGKTANFMRKMTDQITLFTEQYGKEPNNQEVEHIIDRMLIRGEVDGSGYFVDDVKYGFEVSEEDKTFMITDIDNIPEALRRNVERSLKQKGFKLTEANIFGMAHNYQRKASGLMPLTKEQLVELYK